jgi:hypothetical protein
MLEWKAFVQQTKAYFTGNIEKKISSPSKDSIPPQEKGRRWRLFLLTNFSSAASNDTEKMQKEIYAEEGSFASDQAKLMEKAIHHFDGLYRQYIAAKKSYDEHDDKREKNQPLATKAKTTLLNHILSHYPELSVSPLATSKRNRVTLQQNFEDIIKNITAIQKEIIEMRNKNNAEKGKPLEAIPPNFIPLDEKYEFDSNSKFFEEICSIVDHYLQLHVADANSDERRKKRQPLAVALNKHVHICIEMRKYLNNRANFEMNPENSEKQYTTPYVNPTSRYGEIKLLHESNPHYRRKTHFFTQKPSMLQRLTSSRNLLMTAQPSDTNDMLAAKQSSNVSPLNTFSNAAGPFNTPSHRSASIHRPTPSQSLSVSTQHIDSGATSKSIHIKKSAALPPMPTFYNTFKISALILSPLYLASAGLNLISKACSGLARLGCKLINACFDKPNKTAPLVIKGISVGWLIALSGVFWGAAKATSPDAVAGLKKLGITSTKASINPVADNKIAPQSNDNKSHEHEKSYTHSNKRATMISVLPHSPSHSINSSAKLSNLLMNATNVRPDIPPIMTSTSAEKEEADSFQQAPPTDHKRALSEIRAPKKSALKADRNSFVIKLKTHGGKTLPKIVSFKEENTETSNPDSQPDATKRHSHKNR